MNMRAVCSRWWIAGLVVLSGCGMESEPAAVAQPVAETEAPQETEEAQPDSVAEQVIEAESEMNEALEASAEEEPEEEERKSPIRIVPTRPMFQDDWQDEYDDEYRYEDEYEDYDDEYYEAEDEPEDEYEGPQITDYHLKNLREQQSLYIIQDLMPVPGRLIDRYYQGRREYEVWEWRSYSKEEGETLVRIRFIDDDAWQIMINPGEYVLIR